MPTGNEKIYPDCPVVTRMVESGGLTKSQIRQKLQQHSILLNESAERLFADDKFTTSSTKYVLHTVELTIADLGFPAGATMNEILKRAHELGLALCPLELGPHLRLAYLDQPEGYLNHPLTEHQAPPGSITIASEILTDDHDFPKGFYLRRINGELWLRGYIADDLHVWNPDNHFVFCQSNESLKRGEKVMVNSEWPQDLPVSQVRIARPTDKMEEIVRFYTEGIGLERIGGFKGHSGYDGELIGLPGTTYHSKLYVMSNS